ncbi:NUDIX hydrolase domain containing protein [Rhodotorula toruloides]|uniref:NUDIX hydrolase domain containing protein n=1 Tax=Rhodotorula toruloides TaxID=5286 RepID=A0A511KPI7_RHOTO|nr:NUDIX hydrolase domain containing protein [Rhodotorula toruloides]
MPVHDDLRANADLSLLDEALRTTLSDATDRARDQLRRLARYSAPPAQIEFPKPKLAAVLVLLHLNPLNELSVTLTTRSKRLRSHPGETALPGGRWEEGDGEGGEWTALREAWEEIGLPLPPRPAVPRALASPPTSPPPHLLYLTTLPAFTSRTLLVVLPVVYLLNKPASSASTYLSETLRVNKDEVDEVFHLPLRSFLMRDEGPSTSSSSSSTQTRSRPLPSPLPGSETLEHTYADFTWLLSRPYRLHHFAHPSQLVTPSPVTGLTADIVVETALLASPGEVGFVRRAEGQMQWDEIVDEAMRVHARGAGAESGSRKEGADERTSAT